MNELLDMLRPFFELVASDHADPSRASRSVSDLVQEAEVLAWRNIRQFEGSDDEAETALMFRAWVRRLVQRLSRDVQRRRSAQRRNKDGQRVLPLDARRPDATESAPGRIEAEALQSTASGRLMSSERARRVQAAIDELPTAEDREILRAHFFQEISLREIARRLDIPQSTVKDRFRRSVRQLELKLRDLWR